MVPASAGPHAAPVTFPCAQKAPSSVLPGDHSESSNTLTKAPTQTLFSHSQQMNLPPTFKVIRPILLLLPPTPYKHLHMYTHLHLQSQRCAPLPVPFTLSLDAY